MGLALLVSPAISQQVFRVLYLQTVIERQIKMSWGYHYCRSAMEVQRDNSRSFNFDRIRELYETTKPIGGKRECLNIRPVGERGRSHERIVKISDEEYYLTCNSWARVNSDKTVVDRHCRAITFVKEYYGGGENMIIHIPKTSRGQNAPSWFNSPSVYWFYHYKLPENFAMHNHRGKKYVSYTLDGKTNYYSLNVGDLVFHRQKDSPHFKPLQIHREFKRELDREQTKKLREKIKPLADYIYTMIEIVENETYKSGNPLNLLSAEQLFKQEPDESWFQLVEIYKRSISDYDWIYDPNTKQSEKITKYNKHLLKQKIYNHLYRKMKPFKITEVPIGEVCYDKFKNWE